MGVGEKTKQSGWRERNINGEQWRQLIDQEEREEKNHQVETCI